MADWALVRPTNLLTKEEYEVKFEAKTDTGRVKGLEVIASNDPGAIPKSVWISETIAGALRCTPSIIRTTWYGARVLAALVMFIPVMPDRAVLLRLVAISVTPTYL